MTPNKNVFSTLRQTTGRIRVANNTTIPIIGIGTIFLTSLRTYSSYETVVLSDVIYAPGLGERLFSWEAAARKGFEIHGKGSEIIVTKDGKEVLYSVSDGKSPIIQLAENKSRLSYFDWHKALDHPTPGNLKNSTKIYGINFPKLPKDFHCPSCAKSKSTKSIPKPVKK
jgi:hypothetical protein